jgi:pectate lyase
MTCPNRTTGALDNGAQDIGRLKVTYHHNWFDGSNPGSVQEASRHYSYRSDGAAGVPSLVSAGAGVGNI